MSDWMKCSDPPEESCSDGECPVHGEPEWDSEDSNAYVAAEEAREAGTPAPGEQET